MVLKGPEFFGSSYSASNTRASQRGVRIGASGTRPSLFWLPGPTLGGNATRCEQADGQTIAEEGLSGPAPALGENGPGGFARVKTHIWVRGGSNGPVNNLYLADVALWAELGNVPPGVTVMVVVRGSQHKAPAADERYVNPGGRGDFTQAGGNQLTKKHMTKELEKYYFEADTDSYVIVDPARDADPNARSYKVRVICHCRSEEYAEELMEEGLDVVHIITVSKCEKANYASSGTKKTSARPTKKPRASSRGRRSPPVEPLSPATVAPPSPPSPGAKIDAALASPEAPPPAPVSSPDEPDDEPEDPMLALEYTGP